jgi:hypothetical protein
VVAVGGDTAPGNKYVAWGEPPLVFTMPAYSLTAWQRDLVTPPPAATTNAVPVPKP